MLNRCAPHGELILIATAGESVEQLAWLSNAAANMNSIGLQHWVLLSESADACARHEHRGWACSHCGVDELGRNLAQLRHAHG